MFAFFVSSIEWHDLTRKNMLVAINETEYWNSIGKFRKFMLCNNTNTTTTDSKYTNKDFLSPYSVSVSNPQLHILYQLVFNQRQRTSRRYISRGWLQGIAYAIMGVHRLGCEEGQAGALGHELKLYSLGLSADWIRPIQITENNFSKNHLIMDFN